MISTPRMVLARQLMDRLRKRPRRGFTLIELLVVVVIIGILASVALPSFVGAQDKARNAGVQANINTVRMGLEQFATDHNGSYPTTDSFCTSDTLGLRTNNYIPGNQLPRSPWATTVQTADIATSGSMVDATAIAGGSSMPALQASIGATGAVTTLPSAATHYGAIEYQLDTASQTYVVYGTGKKGKAAIIGAEVSNGGN